MKFSPSSLLTQKNLLALFGAVLTLAVAGCGLEDKVHVPHMFGGNEVPPEIMAEPRVVPTPSQDQILRAQETWPRLGDVPSMPKNFTPQPVINASKIQMENNRAIGDALRQEYEPSLAPMPTAADVTPAAAASVPPATAGSSGSTP